VDVIDLSKERFALVSNEELVEMCYNLSCKYLLKKKNQKLIFFLLKKFHLGAYKSETAKNEGLNLVNQGLSKLNHKLKKSFFFIL
jgi:hypothetical protein